MAFIAYEVALEMAGGLGDLCRRIEKRDRNLADQIRRAGSSVVLNLAEGAERKGGDRFHSFRIAAGSTAEVRAALTLALLWSYVEEVELAPTLARLQRLGGLLYGLVNRDRISSERRP